MAEKLVKPHINDIDTHLYIHVNEFAYEREKERECIEIA